MTQHGTSRGDDNGKQPLWFLRRGGEVVGPFPSGNIRRFLLLGRLDLGDEVSRDAKHWQPAREIPEVVPRELRGSAAADPGALPRARRREDERSGRERRRAAARPPTERRCQERREPEEESLVSHRRVREQLQVLSRPRVSLAPLILAGLAFLLLVGFGVWYQGPAATDDPQCQAAAAPGVNWRSCNLSGLVAPGSDLAAAVLNTAVVRGANLAGATLDRAELDYADLSGSDLSHTHLAGASLKGANLRGADLAYADLQGADLRYSDLSAANLASARLERARLEHAIWIDGSKCAVGSIGGCRVWR